MPEVFHLVLEYASNYVPFHISDKKIQFNFTMIFYNNFLTDNRCLINISDALSVIFPTKTVVMANFLAVSVVAGAFTFVKSYSSLKKKIK